MGVTNNSGLEDILDKLYHLLNSQLESKYITLVIPHQIAKEIMERKIKIQKKILKKQKKGYKELLEKYSNLQEAISDASKGFIKANMQDYYAVLWEREYIERYRSPLYVSTSQNFRFWWDEIRLYLQEHPESLEEIEVIYITQNKVLSGRLKDIIRRYIEEDKLKVF